MDTVAQTGEVRVEAAALTDIGHTRDSNEDAYLIATLQRSMHVLDASPVARGWFQGEAMGTLLVVADGMGGQGGGSLASSTAVHAVADYLLNCMPWAKISPADLRSRVSQTGLRAQLSSALVMTDKSVKTTAAQSSTPRMGTTLTVALVLWPAMYVAHVGDTRCYLMQSGRLRRVTTDHNLAQRYADESPNAVDPPAHFQNILWNALGGTSGLPKPEVHKLLLEPDATILLCSDGLNKHVSDAGIDRILRGPGSCAARCAMLVEEANAAGGTDNVTVVLAQVVPSDPASRER
jgi:serine/threonine protein phosphatase PrpC